MSADRVRLRYQEVLALLNEGENEERWILGEFVRLTVEREQERAAATMEVEVRSLRLHLRTKANERGIRLAELPLPIAVAASLASPNASPDPDDVCGPAHRQTDSSTSPLSAPHGGAATGAGEDLHAVRRGMTPWRDR